MSGHDVHIAGDGPAALVVAERVGPAVALLDIGLPGMDGYELGQRLRAAHPAIRLVAVTGYGQDRDAQRAREAGFDAQLVKPLTIDALQETLAELRAKAAVEA